LNTPQDDDYLRRADRFFGRLGLWMYGHKLIVLLCAVGMLGAGLFFAAQTRTDNSFDSFFDATDPAYSAYMTYQEEFGSDEVAYILYSVPRGEYGPFDLDAMQRIAQLTETLEYEVPFVKQVTSLTNVEFITAEGDFLEVHELALDMPEDQAGLLERREAMLKKPSYRGSLIDDAVSHGAIILEMTITSSDPLDELRLDPDGGDGIANLYPQAPNRKILEILARPEYQGIEFQWSGDVPMNTAYNETIEREAALQTLLTIGLVSIIALVCFRMQLLGLVGPLTVVILGLVLTVGFMGLAGYKLGALFLIAPTLLIAIGVAQSVHLIAEFNLMRAHGLDRREAVKQTLEHVAVPCLLAAVTTATGFLVMAGSQLRALSELAVYLGAGVMLTFLASITVMVCYMSMGGDGHRRSLDPSEKTSGVLYRFLSWVAAINLKRPLSIVALFGVALAVSIAGTGRLQVGFNFLDEFKPHTEYRQHTSYVQDVMGGMLNVVFVYDAGEADAIRKAAILSHLEGLQDYAEQSPIVRKTYSVVDILKDINQSFHGDDPAYYRLPDSDELIAQYLLMYEISGGEELEDYLSSDYRRATLELRVDLTDSSRIETLIHDLEQYLEAHPASGARIQITGIGLLWIKMAEYIAQSQLWGYGLAFSIIALVLCLAFRSIRVGLLAMIPNLFPVVLVLGLMGWQGIPLDYFRLLLATVAIGIAVDDTVHVTTRIRREFQRCGEYEESVRVSLMSVGRALVITTVILSLSFLVFLMSDMAVLANFGILLFVTMVTALVADLFLLPALVLVFKPFGPERYASETAGEATATTT
jgi:predicted RND superfamily exporter protein